MKKLLFLTLLLGLASISYAQTTLFSAKLKKVEVPTVIIESIEEDFPNETVTDYYGVPVEIIDDVWFVNTNKSAEDKDFDTYSVVLKTQDGTIHANYDKDGNLISKHEVMKDIALPMTIQKAVARHFPGWTLTGDKKIMTAYKGGHQKVHYKVALKKDSEVFHAVFDSNGNLAKGKEHSVHHKLLERKKMKNN